LCADGVGLGDDVVERPFGNAEVMSQIGLFIVCVLSWVGCGVAGGSESPQLLFGPVVFAIASRMHSSTARGRNVAAVMASTSPPSFLTRQSVVSGRPSIGLRKASDSILVPSPGVSLARSFWNVTSLPSAPMPTIRAIVPP
jgi:hypothetical protein